jgi:hypothetical protein
MSAAACRALAAIDAANAADPKAEALIYGQRMTRNWRGCSPQASEVLQIAARGQHVERWLLPRSDYPEGKRAITPGGASRGGGMPLRVAEIMAEAGYGPATASGSGSVAQGRDQARPRGAGAGGRDLLRLPALVFRPLRRRKGRRADAVDIVGRPPARCRRGRARVLAEFDLPEPLAGGRPGRLAVRPRGLRLRARPAPAGPGWPGRPGQARKQGSEASGKVEAAKPAGRGRQGQGSAQDHMGLEARQASTRQGQRGPASTRGRKAVEAADSATSQAQALVTRLIAGRPRGTAGPRPGPPCARRPPRSRPPWGVASQPTSVSRTMPASTCAA